MGKADTTDQAYWVADMEAAMASARFQREGVGEEDSEDGDSSESSLSDDSSITRVDPVVDTEGSIRFRRRRKK